MPLATLSHLSRALALAAISATANMVSVMPVLADVNVGALSCQPTVASAAAGGSLVWHQHYLINPPTATATKVVVCNIPYPTATLPETFSIGAFGLNSEGAATLISTCYANVVDLRNMHVPDVFDGEAFLNSPGQDMSYAKIMKTQTKTNYLWSAWATIKFSEVIGAMGNPPQTPIDPTGTDGPAYWAITVNCQLKPGQALSMVSLFPTAFP